MLAEEYAVKLQRLAERTQLRPETLARSLLSRALDQADPSADSVTAVLDSIEGAYEKALAGSRDVRAGRFVRLDDL